jgi:hypothetical protein
MNVIVSYCIEEEGRKFLGDCKILIKLHIRIQGIYTALP